VAARYRSALATFGADPDAAGPEAAAGRVAGSAVRDRLVAALDYVLWQGGLPAARAALRLLDPDPLRGLVRDAWAAGRAPAAVAGPAAASAVLTGLPGRVGAADQPPGFVAVLGDDGAVPAGVRRVLLGTAIQRRPADPGLLLAMGYTYRMNRWDTADERARWYQAAVAASPDNPVPHTLLGSAMRDRGDHDGAVACHREAVRLAPNYAMAHNNLGHALWRKGDLDGAVAEYREAIRLDPNHALAHDNLGAALAGKGDWEGSEWECREAIRLDPSHAMAHSNLGYHLKRRGDLDGAVAEYREAIRLDPNHALAHVNLGWVLEQRGDLDGAVAEYREGLRADPTNAKAHNSLGWVLQQKGELEEAVSSYKEALRLDPKQPYAVANLPRAERMRTLLPRLPGVLAGTDRPATPAEALGFAELCGQPFQGRYAAAARLYEHAFALDPALADVLFTSAGGHRYDAACYAARAARGDGVDAPADPAGRAALRAQALSWLRADLAVRQKQAASQAGSERRAAAAALAHWLGDSDLSAVRHPLVLAALPAAEAREWLALWADVRWTLAEAHKPAPPPEAAPPPRAK
jgi:tetratricopeptide (TPR) repeat protein